MSNDIKAYVLVKYVPDRFFANVDENNNLKRDTAKLTTNPYDLYSMATALNITKKDDVNIKYNLLSMGPLCVQSNLQESLAFGFDEAILLSDRAFAGSDVLATTKALSSVFVTFNDYSFIVCGRQSTDSDTGQIGYSLAASLRLPCVDFVVEILSVNKSHIELRRECDSLEEIISCPMPCIIITDAKDQHLKTPTLVNKLKARKKEVQILKLDNLKLKNKSFYGIEGSATYVTDMQVIKSSEHLCTFINKDELLKELLK